MAELLPCPFCGSEVEIERLSSIFGGYDYVIICPNCLIKKFDEKKEVVIKEWNSRVESQELPEWAKQAICNCYQEAAKESTLRSQQLNKHSEFAECDDYYTGYMAALRWVLSLNPPAEQEVKS